MKERRFMWALGYTALIVIALTYAAVALADHNCKIPQVIDMVCTRTGVDANFEIYDCTDRFRREHSIVVPLLRT
jgi:hypothetical protein